MLTFIGSCPEGTWSLMERLQSNLHQIIYWNTRQKVVKADKNQRLEQWKHWLLTFSLTALWKSNLLPTTIENIKWQEMDLLRAYYVPGISLGTLGYSYLCPHALSPVYRRKPWGQEWLLVQEPGANPAGGTGKAVSVPVEPTVSL